MAPRKLKFLVHCLEGTGHVNAVLGYCQALAAEGHECVFAVNESLTSVFEKFNFRAIPLQQNTSPANGKTGNGVNGNGKTENGNGKAENGNGKAESEFAYSDNPAKDMAATIKAMGIFEDKDSMGKLSAFKENEEEAKFMENIKNLLIKFNPQLERIVEEEKADCFILDHFLFPPALGRDDTPWIMIGSAAPLTIYNTPQLPPPTSGYPSNDQTGWDEFFSVYDEGSKFWGGFQQQVDDHFKYDGNGSHYQREGYFLRSPFLNVHQSPKELDYRDIYTPPKNVIAVDSFCRQEAPKLELPEEFEKAHENGQKLVYLSMGSMGSFDIDLMQRLAGILSQLPNVKTIVSKGPRGDEYELPANCWGQNTVSQPAIIELVDLVITHGGNNSVCESFIAGKPMIVLPLFGDQYDNAQRVYETGYGRRFEPYAFKDDDFVDAVKSLLSDEKLKARLQTAKLRVEKEKTLQKAARHAADLLLNR